MGVEIAIGQVLAGSEGPHMRVASCNSLVILAVLGLAPARADVIELTTGGRVEGRLLESADGDNDVQVIELGAGARLAIPRSQIARVNSTSDADAEYEKLARSAPDTVEAHEQLAEWCRERKMRERMQRHFERVLELDPNHEAARIALGFRKRDGQWMTRDEIMDDRGLVLYGGRYITPQAAELLERQKEVKSEQADWGNKLDQLRRWLTGRRPERAAEALAEIRALRDPLAADAVVALLRREKDPALKRLWMEVASRLDHRAAIDVLVDLSLYDEDPEIRHDALEYLVNSGRKGLLRPYLRALKKSNNEIVNRAAAALGKIGDRDAAGPLIEALITQHTYRIAGGNPNQHAYAMSPDGGQAFNFGGSRPQVVSQAVQNPEVLSALVSLSGGVSFEYDQTQWRRWLAAQARQHVIDLRRDQ
jgi:hypothetical protein